LRDDVDDLGETTMPDLSGKKRNITKTALPSPLRPMLADEDVFAAAEELEFVAASTTMTGRVSDVAGGGSDHEEEERRRPPIESVTMPSQIKSSAAASLLLADAVYETAFRVPAVSIELVPPTVTGMTMTAPNPEYESVRAFRADLLAERAKRAVVSTSARQALRDFWSSSMPGGRWALPTLDVSFERVLARAEADIEAARAAGVDTLPLDWPPAEVDARNHRWTVAIGRAVEAAAEGALAPARIAWEAAKADASADVAIELQVTAIRRADAAAAAAVGPELTDSQARAALDAILFPVVDDADVSRATPITVGERRRRAVARWIGVLGQSADVLVPSDAALAAAQASVDAAFRVEETVEAVKAVTAALDTANGDGVYYRLPLVREEVAAYYAEYLNRLAAIRASGAALPFVVADGTDLAERDDFLEHIVRANAVPAYASDWFDRWIDTGGGAGVDEPIRNAIRAAVTQLVTGRPDTVVGDDGRTRPASAPRPSVDAYDTTLRTWEDVMRDVGAFVDGVRGQWARNVPTRLNAGMIDRGLRTLQAKYTAGWLADAASAQLKAHDAQLARTQPTIDVPVDVDLTVGTSESIVLRVAAAYPVTSNVNDRPPAGAVYEFAWHFRPGGIAAAETVLRRVRRAVPGDSSEPVADTFAVPSSSSSRVSPAHAGQYVVAVSVIVPPDAQLAVERVAARAYSETAAVHVFGRCVRDGARFEVGEGATRVFGECSWSAPPNVDAVPPQQRLRLVGSLPTDDDGETETTRLRRTVDTAGLAAVHDAYFTYNGIVDRIGDDARRAYEKRYSRRFVDALVGRVLVRLVSTRHRSAVASSSMPFAVALLRSVFLPTPPALVDQLEADVAADENNALASSFVSDVIDSLRDVTGPTDARDVALALATTDPSRPLHSLPSAPLVRALREARLLGVLRDALSAREVDFLRRVAADDDDRADKSGSRRVDSVGFGRFVQSLNRPIVDAVRSRAAGSLDAARWLGVHSLSSSVPGAYTVEVIDDAFDPDRRPVVVVNRDAERQESGYDFAGLHAAIMTTARAIGSVSSAPPIPRERAKARVQRLVDAYNTLSALAPPRPLDATIQTVAEIESAFAAL
jgi:hypothetical protein